MSTSSVLRYPSVLKLFYFAFVLPIIIAKPVPSNETLYDVSIRSLINNKCKMPKEIKFPFSKISDPSTFNYLKIPLNECQIAEPSGKNMESNLLCKEIFEVLKNITCSKYNNSLPEIKSLPETDDVCSEFKSMENIIPNQNESISLRLKDDLTCNLLCQDKFEILCQTLLWSYNVQYQLRNSLLTEVAENENDKTITSKDTQKIPQQPVLDTSDNPSKAEYRVTDSQAANEDVNEQAKNTNDLNANNLELQNINSFGNPTASSQLDTVAISDNSLGDNNKNPKVISSTPNGNIQESKVSGSDVQVDVKSTNVESNQVIAKNKEPLSNDLPGKGMNADKISKNITPPIATHDMRDKEVHSSILPDQSKSKTNAPKHNIETNPNPETPSIPNVVEGNEFKNEDGEENESKVQGKSSDSEIPLTNNTKKLTDTKETNSAIPSKIASNIESSTLQISSDINANAEQEDEQEEKDVDQYYNDTENEGDYSKPEYENPLNEVSKAKKPEIKSSVISEAAKPNELSSNYEFMNRNNIGRGHDMQMVSTFPEQEDGHFFFYFLSIVLILMAGYLIFHNKQKIIALIVEGRHERRRRSHGAGYKKLETK